MDTTKAVVSAATGFRAAQEGPRGSEPVIGLRKELLKEGKASR